MPPYQPCGATSHGGVPYPTVWIISLPSCCGRHPVYVLARAVWRYGILPPLFCLKKKENTVCTRCFHSLRVVLDTKCCTAPALSCTRIPMCHTSKEGLRSLLSSHRHCINFKINLRKSCSIFFHKNSHLPLKR